MKLSSRITASIVLTLGIIFCAIIISSTWRANVRSLQTISVIGSARMDIVSDMGVLRGSITVVDANSAKAYQKIKSEIPVVLNYLKSKGIKAEMTEVFPVNSYPNYEYTANGYQTGKISSYNVSQRFQVKSADVQKIKAISLEITDLMNEDINLQMESPEYYYSKLSDIKIKIQADAAFDAENHAKRIAESTGSSLGPMRGAKMGILQITPKNSNIVADYGINDVSSIEKEITAVVHASFQIN